MLSLIVDTREQLELEFAVGRVFDEIRHEKLDVGDYGAEIDGKRLPLVFDRKAIGDLYGTLTHGNARFHREIERAKKTGTLLVLLIEGSLKDVQCGYAYSMVSGDTILKTAFSLWVRHDVVPVFCNDRDECRRFVEETFASFERCWEKEK